MSDKQQTTSNNNNCVCEYCPEEYDVSCSNEHSHTNEPYASEVALQQMWDNGVQKWQDYTTCHSTVNYAAEATTGYKIPGSGIINKVANVTDFVSATNNVYQGNYIEAAKDAGSFAASKFGPVGQTIYGVTVGGACQNFDNDTIQQQPSDFVPLPYRSWLDDESYKVNNRTSIGNLEYLNRPQVNYEEDIEWQKEQQEARENFYDNFNRPYESQIEEDDNLLPDDTVIDNEQSHSIDEHNHNNDIQENHHHSLNDDYQLENNEINSHSLIAKVSDNQIMLVQDENGNWQSIYDSEYIQNHFNNEFDTAKQEISEELNYLQKELNQKIDDIGFDIGNSMALDEYNNQSSINNDQIEKMSNISFDFNDDIAFNNENNVLAKVSDNSPRLFEDNNGNQKIMTFDEWLKENPSNFEDDPLFVNIEDDINDKYAEKDDTDEQDWLF